VARHPLDERFPSWGESPYFSLTLRSTIRLKQLLSHLYVLVPVLDDEKHYWVGQDELEKLLRHGADWLVRHPERRQIVRRYLRHRGGLVRSALARLMDDDVADPDETAAAGTSAEATVEAAAGGERSLGAQRLAAVLAELKAAGARRVVDLGCGEGRLLQSLTDDGAFEELVGMDISPRALERAARRLGLDRRPPARRVRLIQGALTYRDRRLEGFDAATVVEVIEHLDATRLRDFEAVLFGQVRPRLIVLTTPNAEYNVRFEGLPAGTFRHRDHQFEWTRAQFEAWARAVAGRHGYGVRFEPVGAVDPAVGPPTQLVVFSRD
jgi:3' terminal RNA ribose 2'-O-methyltransferase Hen1